MEFHCIFHHLWLSFRLTNSGRKTQTVGVQWHVIVYGLEGEAGATYLFFTEISGM